MKGWLGASYGGRKGSTARVKGSSERMHPFRKVCILFAFEPFPMGGKGQTHEQNCQKYRAKACILFGKYAYFPKKYASFSKKDRSFLERMHTFQKVCILLQDTFERAVLKSMHTFRKGCILLHDSFARVFDPFRP